MRYIRHLCFKCSAVRSLFKTQSALVKPKKTLVELLLLTLRLPNGGTLAWSSYLNQSAIDVASCSIFAIYFFSPSFYLLIIPCIYCFSFCRTDSALKFGWFFLCYLVWSSIKNQMYLLELRLWSVITSTLHFLFDAFRFILASASLQLLHRQYFSRGNLWRKYLHVMYFHL